MTSIQTISDSFISMSAAFEEQSQVSDEINRQISNIAELADHSDAQADSAKQSSDRLSAMSRGLKDLISQVYQQKRLVSFLASFSSRRNQWPDSGGRQHWHRTRQCWQNPAPIAPATSVAIPF